VVLGAELRSILEGRLVGINAIRHPNVVGLDTKSVISTWRMDEIG
jgi:hypothetical protein